MPRVLFLGTPEIAVVTLRALWEAGNFQLVGVVTQPDRPAGRGKRLKSCPVKEVAQTLNLPLFQPPRIRGNPSALAFLEQTRPDLLVVVAFGQILPQEFFSWPKWGALNLHTSLLPRYRGAAPVIRALLAGETRTGVTLMKIDAGMDTGDTLASRETSIGPDETAGELENRLAVIGARLLLDTLPRYLSEELQPTPQDDSRVSLAPPVKKEEARVDWGLPAEQIHNRVRAFNPRPGALAEFRNQPLKIWRSTHPRASLAPAPGGTILRADSEIFTLACGEGTALDLLEVQPANRRRLSRQDFFNGFAPRAGEILQ